MISCTPEPTARNQQAAFVTTRWSVVLASAGAPSSEADAAQAELCRTDWYPLYALVRRKGHSAHDAQDLTQAVLRRGNKL